MLVKEKALQVRNSLVDSQDMYYVDSLLSTFAPEAAAPKDGLRLLKGSGECMSASKEHQELMFGTVGEVGTDFGDYVTYLNSLLLESEIAWLACVQSSSSALIDDDSMPVQEVVSLPQ